MELDPPPTYRSRSNGRNKFKDLLKNPQPLESGNFGLNLVTNTDRTGPVRSSGMDWDVSMTSRF